MLSVKAYKAWLKETHKGQYNLMESQGILDKHCREQVERAKEYQYQIQDSLESQAARRGELAKTYQENVETYMAIQQQAEEMARAYLYEMD